MITQNVKVLPPYCFSSLQDTLIPVQLSLSTFSLPPCHCHHFYRLKGMKSCPLLLMLQNDVFFFPDRVFLLLNNSFWFFKRYFGCLFAYFSLHNLQECPFCFITAINSNALWYINDGRVLKCVLNIRFFTFQDNFSGYNSTGSKECDNSKVFPECMPHPQNLYILTSL